MTPQEFSVPYGYCHCLCGQRTRINKQSITAQGILRGEPRRFITGHHGRIIPKIEEAVPFKIDGVYCRLIPLTGGQWTIVDETDYVWLMQWKWWARKHADSYVAIRQVKVNGKYLQIRMHNLIHPPPPELETDHRNLVTLDNRRKNLRPADRGDQVHNRRTPRSNTSGFKGVDWQKHHKQYQARIGIGEGVRLHLGFFGEDKIAAAHAYDDAARKYHGEFARLNFPD